MNLRVGQPKRKYEYSDTELRNCTASKSKTRLEKRGPFSESGADQLDESGAEWDKWDGGFSVFIPVNPRSHGRRHYMRGLLWDPSACLAGHLASLVASAETGTRCAWRA